MVSWTGNDVGSGIHYYDVQYRFNGGNWFPWQQPTLATSGIFLATNGDGVYAFEVRAVDKVGLIEPFAKQA